MAYVSVFETDFGAYYLGPHLAEFLRRARDIRLPKWVPWFIRQWLWRSEYKTLLKAWEYHERMEAIAVERWKANEDLTGIIEIGRDGELVVKSALDLSLAELEYFDATQAEAQD